MLLLPESRLLAALSLPAGVLAGTFLADRLARGSAAAVARRYEDRLLAVPGVRRVAASKTNRGRPVVAVYFESLEALRGGRSRVPERLDGYEVSLRPIPLGGAPLERRLDSAGWLGASPRHGFVGTGARGTEPWRAVLDLLFPYLEAGVLLAAPRMEGEERGHLSPEELRFHAETRAAVERALARILADNSRWWDRFTGKRRLVRQLTDAFRQELRKGRRPAFEAAFDDDGASTALRGPAGESAAELLWAMLKADAGLSEAELGRFLSVGRRLRLRGRLDAEDPPAAFAELPVEPRPWWRGLPLSAKAALPAGVLAALAPVAPAAALAAGLALGAALLFELAASRRG